MAAGQAKRFAYIEDGVLVDDAGTPVDFQLPGAFLGLAANQAGMLAYAAEPGNLVMRTDSTPDFLWVCISTNTPPGNINNWQKLSTFLTTVASQAAMLAVVPQFAGQYVLRSDDGYKPYFWNGSDPTQVANWVLGGGGGGSTVYRGVAANQAAMVALVSAVRGDYCYRTDRASVGSGFWKLSGTDPTVAANWFEESDYLGIVANQAAMLALTPSRPGQFCIRSDQGYAMYQFNNTGAATLAASWTNWTTLLNQLSFYSTYDGGSVERLAGMLASFPGMLNDTGKIYPTARFAFQKGFTAECINIATAGAFTASSADAGASTNIAATAHGLTAGDNGRFVYCYAFGGTAGDTPGHYALTYVDANNFKINLAWNALRTTVSVSGGTTNDTTGLHALMTVTIPGGSMGPNGRVNFSLRIKQAGTATRYARLKADTNQSGTTLSNGTSANAGTNFHGCDINNLGSDQNQWFSPFNGSADALSSISNFDTSVARTWTVWYAPAAVNTPFHPLNVSCQVIPGA